MLYHVSSQLIEANLDEQVARLVKEENLAFEVVPALRVRPLQHKVA